MTQIIINYLVIAYYRAYVIDIEHFYFYFNMNHDKDVLHKIFYSYVLNLQHGTS